MKITINVDCTPEEARAFLGLPDVRPIQEAMMAEMEERMRSGLAAMDPEAVMKMWMAPMMNFGAGNGFNPTEQWGDNWEALQKAFWANMTPSSDKTED